jgi:hypothetical protein
MTPCHTEVIVRKSGDGTSEVNPDHDYLREQIRKLVQFVARLLGHAAPDHLAQQARHELTAEAGRLLGHPYELLGRLTPESAAQLLGHDPDRVEAYANVLFAEARLLTRAGDFASASQRTARARAVRGQLPGLLEPEARPN